jgi:hypothetical protein
VARKRLNNGEWQPAFGYERYGSFMKDCEELDLLNASEQAEALKQVLAELTPIHYNGPHPPLVGSRGEILDKELFAFVLASKFLRETVYLKFSIDKEQLYIVSFHKARR